MLQEIKQLAQRAFDDDRTVAVVELLECYLESCPDDGFAWSLYGDALRILGRFGPAVIALGNAERLSPPKNRWAVQGRLGLVFHDKGDFSSAERWFSKAVQDENATLESWIWVCRGGNFASQGLFDEAEECHRNAIDLNDRDEEAHVNLALILRAKGRYDEARHAAERALQLCPDYPAASEIIQSLEGATEARRLAEQFRSQTKEK